MMPSRWTRRCSAAATPRRLTLETLQRRELLAADVCYPLDPADVVPPPATIVPSGAILMGPIPAAADTLPDVSIGDAAITEGQAGPQTLSFPVTLSAESSDPVTVDVSVTDGSAQAIQFERVASGLSQPLFVTAPAGDQQRLFIVEKTGDIEILNLDTGQRNATPFLSVSGISTNSERGLLGLAFHPEYQTNGRFFVYLTNTAGATVIREYTVSADLDVADPDSAQTLLTFAQPFPNHNGGWMGFGPDGYLYIASGDGGSGHDPGNNAQDITGNLLGKMLRIDVNADDFPSDNQRNYSIPTTNPFVGVTGDDEIWAYGLRNPWRTSFDRGTGDLYIADVGQLTLEEINVQPAESVGGENYGWRLREGTIATPTGPGVGGAKPAGAIDPIYDYEHGGGPDEGNSVTGGYVYRGPIEELQGQYFFADFSNRRIWSLRFNGDEPAAFDGTNYDDFTNWTDVLVPDVGQFNNVASFGEDAAGNLYVVDFGGDVFAIRGGADYQAQSQTLTFDPGVMTQNFEVEVLGDRLFESDEQFTVSLSQPAGAVIGVGVATGTILNDDPAPPEVESIVINDPSDSSRSQVTSLTVTFDTEVDVSASAFRLTNLDSQSTVANVQVNTTVDQGKTVAVLTFLAGDSVVTRQGSGALGNSLGDAAYQLDVIAAEVSSVVGGAALTDDISFGETPADAFFRKYGDHDGDGAVELDDFFAFRAAFGTAIGQAGFRADADADGNGAVELEDFFAFRANFGT